MHILQMLVNQSVSIPVSINKVCMQKEIDFLNCHSNQICKKKLPKSFWQKRLSLSKFKIDTERIYMSNIQCLVYAVYRIQNV